MSTAADIHPMAPAHLPPYVAGADGSDFLMSFMVVFLIAVILGLGVAYFTLHALPEKMAHRSNAVQLQLISVLAMLALFTHNNLFWVAALVLAAFRPPDFITPLNSIAQSLRNLAGGPRRDEAPAPTAEKEG
ncbi:hypothetical protein Dshi_1988 [Dinoroseobacter shibae DFL 12 = DSM 16493]|jgi:hypothetical protein|uniref:Uncharacterized protein n=1 Tax=Dinoroseobacter shibae (strain DSM 16493 / NCIMB 14021 / DFL 12) TaxID=398580 RepID=A8LP45_DINSH|nr:hypothetical protein [Dinoroseobacter shibae]ABV93727.1 hypothetical protein Dshi_1988 [Dinoroseobacter shibae DFL 12 = DSM 16493]URF45181.1 hypothetical protein M8008_10290 [Dinoroseobacter shibae]URF49486.1 hypothetical protein M8007_10290 [Dinoroseobacter shibae]